MEKSKKRRYTEIISAVAITIGICFICFFLPAKTDNHYQVICAGDSIIGNYSDETGIPGLMGTRLNVQVFNGGFGGTTMALRNEELLSDFYIDSLCGVNLMKAIAYKDFTWQLAETERAHGPDYWLDRVKNYSKVDCSQVKVIIIEYGVNDFLTGVIPDNESDLYDEYSYGGALRSSIEILESAYPSAKIILATPTFCKQAEKNIHGVGTLKDYVDVEIKVGKEYGVEVIDNYNNSGINAGNLDKYTLDGLHLNDEGRMLIANILAEHIESGDIL